MSQDSLSVSNFSRIVLKNYLTCNASCISKWKSYFGRRISSRFQHEHLQLPFALLFIGHETIAWQHSTPRTAIVYELITNFLYRSVSAVYSMFKHFQCFVLRNLPFQQPSYYPEMVQFMLLAIIFFYYNSNDSPLEVGVQNIVRIYSLILSLLT